MKDKIKLCVIIGLMIIVYIFIKQFFNEKFDSVESFQAYMKGFGIFAPVALTVFQAFQVVVPVLPGFLGCATGAIMFGTVVGFLCNYIGISAGSIIAFYLGKKYGMDIILKMFKEKQVKRWTKWINKSKSYALFLFIATLLPLFPDDFLCYFSGLMKMKSRKFIWIIILGKPWCILAYSIAFGLIK